jgi:hypothetical protein
MRLTSISVRSCFAYIGGSGARLSRARIVGGPDFRRVDRQAGEPYIFASPRLAERLLMPRTGAAAADGAAAHVGEQIAAGWNLDPDPVFGEVPQPGRSGAFPLRPGYRFRIIGRAVASSTPRSGGRPGQGI